MNRRTFLAAIPAAIAAMTGAKADAAPSVEQVRAQIVALDGVPASTYIVPQYRPLVLAGEPEPEIMHYASSPGARSVVLSTYGLSVDDIEQRSGEIWALADAIDVLIEALD